MTTTELSIAQFEIEEARAALIRAMVDLDYSEDRENHVAVTKLVDGLDAVLVRVES